MIWYAETTPIGILRKSVSRVILEARGKNLGVGDRWLDVIVEAREDPTASSG